MYYTINIQRNIDGSIQWGVSFGSKNHNAADEELMRGVLRNFVSSLEALEQKRLKME